MTDESKQRFDIFLTGSPQSGMEPTTVGERLAELFRIPPHRAAQLLGGKPQRVKADVDRATALRYRDALRQAGAGFAIREAVAAAPSTTPSTTPVAAPAAAPAISPLSVAAPGADLLGPEERASTAPVEIDTSALKIAPLFAASATESAAPPPAPDTSHLTLRVEGDLLDASERRADVQPLPAPAFSLADPGARLDTVPDERPPLAPLIDHLDVAPVGDMLLAESERPPPPPPFEPHESRQWQLTPV